MSDFFDKTPQSMMQFDLSPMSISDDLAPIIQSSSRVTRDIRTMNQWIAHFNSLCNSDSKKCKDIWVCIFVRSYDRLMGATKSKYFPHVMEETSEEMSGLFDMTCPYVDCNHQKYECLFESAATESPAPVSRRN